MSLPRIYFNVCARLVVFLGIYSAVELGFLGDSLWLHFRTRNISETPSHSLALVVQHFDNFKINFLQYFNPHSVHKLRTMNAERNH